MLLPGRTGRKQVNKHFILADDLTGSNATAALLHKSGMSVITVVDPSHLSEVIATGPDAIVCNSGTRLFSPESASARVATLVSRVVNQSRGSVVAFAKRIDSTLRGPLGNEIESFLRQLPSPHVAALVPAYPSSGRTVRGGNLFVHGVPLHLTEMRQDPINPICTAQVQEILKTQTNLVVKWIRTEDLSMNALCDQVIEAIQTGAQIIGCDAETDMDISRLAEAWSKAAERSGVSVLPVDPGPFTAAYFSCRDHRLVKPPRRKVLVVSGSLMGTARQQLDYLLNSRETQCIQLDAGMIGNGRDMDSYLGDIQQRVAQAVKSHDLVVMRTDMQLATSTAGAAMLLGFVGKLVNTVMTSVPFDGLYVSGGETAANVLSEMAVHALEILREVAPLCVLSKVMGGRFDGLRIVTKGGGVGSESVILDSVDALLHPS